MDSIVDYLRIQAREQPDRLFLAEGPEAETSFTFSQMFSSVKRMAYFLADNEVKKGDRVILLIDRRSSHLIAYFASMSIGAIPVHLNTLRPREFVEFAAKNTEAKVLVTENCAGSWEGFSCPILPFPALNEGDPEHWPDERSEIAYMMYTSGTTGLPKAVMTSQANTLFTARTIIDFARLTNSECELICLPLSFTFGLGHIHAQLILGGKAHLLPTMRDVPIILRTLGAHGITGFLASPGMIKTLVEEYESQFAEMAKNLGHIVINCTPMPAGLTKRLLDLLPNTRIYMYYGLTEASRSAYNFYNDNPDKLACTGRATKGVSLRIDNPDPVSGAGEICIKGPNVMLGYWGDEKCPCIDEGAWLHTGDLGVMDQDGFITVKGRVKEQISVDGMKCQPLEIESILAGHADVKDVAVVAIPDEYTYQAVGAALVTDSLEDKTRLIERLRQHCKQRLEAFKVPKRIVFVDRIPRTELGKTMRLEIERMLMDAPEG